MKVTEVKHPILRHKLTLLRDKDTDPGNFRRVMGEMSRLLAYEVMRDLETKFVEVETPLEKTKSEVIGEDLIVVSILRAGNGMLDGVLQMLPFARAGHIGMYRDKFIKTTVEYYFKLPENVKGKRILVLDPMLATAGTVTAAIDRLKQYDVGQIRFACIVASPAGIERLNKEHPDVDIFCLSVERTLDEHNYILPGLGDAGDRLFGTV